jgi:hypothetical protein
MSIRYPGCWVVFIFDTTQHSFAPASWAISCVTFDWVSAVYVAIVFGLLGARRLGFREVAT